MMKPIFLGALVAAQILSCAQQASAADLTEQRNQQMGAFAGLRLRIPLDGDARQRQLRAGLAVAPAMHSRTMGGESRLRIGEGLELGIVGREPVRLSLAGQDVRSLGAAQQGEPDEDGRRGPSTVAWVAIGVAALVVVTATVGYFWLEDRIDDDD
jgi:hypothetical protein